MLGCVFLVSELGAQEIRFKSISLRSFPKVKMVISVENKWGAPVPVDVSRLKLYEEKRLLKNVAVVPQDSRESPIFSVIVLDKSGSMKGEAIKKARDGAVEFVEKMREGDQAATIAFDTQVYVVSEFTPDSAALSAGIRKTAVGSDTALLDAVYRAVEMQAATPPNAVKTVLALTDGRENRSRRKLDEVVERARALNVSIYTIGLGDKIDSGMLTDMARRTEANYYAAPEPRDLTAIYKRISDLLHSQLMVEFTTPFPMDDRWHALRVVIPYMGKEIAGEKPYLSAKESKIPSELVLQIDREQRKQQEEAALQEKLRKEKEARERKGKTLHLVLAGVAAALLLVLLAVVLKKKR